MSRLETVLLVDDLDKSDGATKRKFALDGVSYDIDLNDDNYEQLKEIFAKYIANGRRVPRKRPSNSASKLARAKK